MAYGNKIGVPFVIFLGEDEIAQGKVTLKNMRTGEQETMLEDEARTKIIRFQGQDDAIAPIREA